MSEDDLHDNDMVYDDMDDDEDDEELEPFSITELTQTKDDEQAGPHDIVIEERTIASLAEIVAFANKAQRPVSFERCVVERVRLHTASVDISFEDSLFTEKINFDRALFTGKLDFWDTCFDQETACGGTTFKEEVSFEECLFRTRVNFARAVFEKNVSFTGCDFDGDVTFDNTTFAAGADFSASTFRAKMSCRNAQFEKRVDLANTTFEQAPDITGSNLDEAERAEPADQEGPKRPLPKKPRKRAEFNPWRELDNVSKKTMSRRHLLRGIFRFLPSDKEE
jgi:uncharacterized protein YjbI with pentapeptide repeats